MTPSSAGEATKHMVGPVAAGVVSLPLYQLIVGAGSAPDTEQVSSTALPEGIGVS